MAGRLSFAGRIAGKGLACKADHMISHPIWFKRSTQTARSVKELYLYNYYIINIILIFSSQTLVVM